MIERYTIKFDPAVSLKELEKLLVAGEGQLNTDDLKKMKARIELLCDFNDLHVIDAFIKNLPGVGINEP